MHKQNMGLTWFYDCLPYEQENISFKEKNHTLAYPQVCHILQIANKCHIIVDSGHVATHPACSPVFLDV